MAKYKIRTEHILGHIPVWLATLGLILLLTANAPAQGLECPQQWRGLIARLSQDGYDREFMVSFFSRPDVQYDPQPMRTKMTALYTGRFIDSPLTKSSRATQVYKGMITRKRLAEAGQFMREHRTSLRRASRTYGVPEEIIAAILYVETGLGRNLGRRNTFNVLAGMAACADFDLIDPSVPALARNDDEMQWLRERTRQKADWAYDELKALMDYSGRIGADPLSFKGSIYGAIGICQFMPSNIARYGRDGDGDGFIDVFHLADAIPSVASYLKSNGWRANLGLEGRRNVIMRYNHSRVYANTVLAIAARLPKR